FLAFAGIRTIAGWISLIEYNLYSGIVLSSLINVDPCCMVSCCICSRPPPCVSAPPTWGDPPTRGDLITGAPPTWGDPPTRGDLITGAPPTWEDPLTEFGSSPNPLRVPLTAILTHS